MKMVVQAVVVMSVYPLFATQTNQPTLTSGAHNCASFMS